MTLRSRSPGKVEQVVLLTLATAWAWADWTPGSRYVPLATPQAKSTGQMKRMFFSK